MADHFLVIITQWTTVSFVDTTPTFGIVALNYIQYIALGAVQIHLWANVYLLSECYSYDYTTKNYFHDIASRSVDLI